MRERAVEGLSVSEGWPRGAGVEDERMRFLGLLLTLAIICVLVYLAFKSLGIGQTDVHDAQWFYGHPAERADQLKYCNDHPQEQESPACLSAVSAQTRVDTERSMHT